MKQSLQLRIGQSLTMTPQLQQAIKLLQLSSLELQTEIQQTLDSNPLLEQDDNLGEVTLLDTENRRDGANGEDTTESRTVGENISENRAEQHLPDDLAIDAHWDHIYDSLPSTTGTGSGSRDDHRDLFENQAGEQDSLKDHLNWQLDCAHLSETDYFIGQAIIDSIDDSGYLTQDLEDIFEGLVGQCSASIRSALPRPRRGNAWRSSWGSTIQRRLI